MSEDVAGWDKRFGAAAYNRSWELLETEARSADDDADLLAAAFAQRFHWFRAGGDEQKAIAEWMVSRAAAALGLGAMALTYAERARAIGEGLATPDFLRASIYEGLARAHAAAGDAGSRDAWLERARAALDGIAEADDRSVIEQQIDEVARD